MPSFAEHVDYARDRWHLRVRSTPAWIKIALIAPPAIFLASYAAQRGLLACADLVNGHLVLFYVGWLLIYVVADHFRSYDAGVIALAPFAVTPYVLYRYVGTYCFLSDLTALVAALFLAVAVEAHLEGRRNLESWFGSFLLQLVKILRQLSLKRLRRHGESGQSGGEGIPAPTA